MNNYYEIEKNVNKLLNGDQTFFLDGKMQKEVYKRVAKLNFNIYYPYIDSERVIYYVNDEPKVALFEIISKEKLRHQDIMGSVLNLGIDSEMFGDIVIFNDRYFIYVIDKVKDYLLMNFNKVMNIKITLNEISLDELKDYKRRYEEKTMIVTSERVDTIISHIINSNREKVKDKIKNKEIILNYDILTSHSKIIKKDDIFSIRKYGKYKYLGVVKTTKKDNLIVKYLKYL